MSSGQLKIVTDYFAATVEDLTDEQARGRVGELRGGV